MTTPTWVAPENNQTFANTHVQQLLALHGVTCVYQGASIVQTTGTYQTQQSLANVQVDQPFTMSGTTISRVEIPIRIADESGQDVTISLYANSGGSPTGSAIAATTVPREFLAGTSNSSIFPDQSILSAGSWLTGTGNALPGNSPSGGSAVATYKNLVAMIGGVVNSEIIGTVYTGLASSTGINAWTQQSTLPIPHWGNAAAISSTSYVYSIGGYNSVSGGASTITADVYYAPINLTTGDIGGWLTTTSLPTTGASGGAFIMGNNLYYIGGVTGSGGLLPSVNTVYSAAIGSDGSLSSWSTLTPLPFSGYANFPLPTVCNGWVVAQIGTSWVMASVTSTTLGSWLAAPTVATSGGPSAAVIDNSIIISGFGSSAQNVYSLTFGTSGPAKRGWVSLTNEPSGAEAFAGVASATTSTATSPSTFTLVYDGWAPVQTVQIVSVPLNVTGLSNGVTYHIVISGSSNTTTTGVQDSTVGIISSISGGGAFTGQSKIGAGAWTGLTSGYGVPLQLFTGNTGRLYHTMEDITSGVPADWNWYLYNYWGGLTGIGEYQAQVRSFRTITTDSSGLPTATS